MAVKSRSVIQAVFFNYKKLWIWLAFTIGGIAILYGITSVALTSYLSSTHLRNQLDEKAARILNAESCFLPLSWRGLSVHSEGFAAQSPRHQGITKVEIRGIDARCGLMSLWHGTVVVHDLVIKHLQVASGEAAAKQISSELFPQPAMTQPGKDGVFFTADVRHTVIEALDIFWGDKPDSLGGLKTVQVTMQTAGKDLDVEGKGGTLFQSGIPDLQINSLHLHYTKPDLFIKESSLHFGKEDHVSITGQLTFADKSSEKLDFKFEDCPVADFLPAKWRKRFTGVFSSQSKITMISSDKSTLDAEGNFDIGHAVLQGMPAQKKLASVTHKPEFEHLSFNKLGCEYTYKKNMLKASRFEAVVEGLFIVRGNFEIRQGEIDANLKVGVVPSAIEGIPGASKRVFTEADGGYLWTHMKVTGSLQHPREDLSPRLLTAAKEEILRSFLRIPTAPEMVVMVLLGRLFDE